MLDINSKRFILVILLVFCLYSRKIHANITGNGKCWIEPGDTPAEILNVEWLPNYNLKVTVQSPSYDGRPCKFAPEAIGHFTFKDNETGKSYRFSKSAVWINGYGYESTKSDNCPEYVGVNPYDYIVNYDSKAAPRIGASVTVALSIYYDCATIGDKYANCLSCDVKYQTTYR